MPNWSVLEKKKGRPLSRWHDHLHVPVLILGSIIIVSSVIVDYLSRDMELTQIGFLTLGIGGTLIVSDVINAVDRLDNYLRTKPTERRLYSLAEQSLSNARVAAQLATSLYYLSFDKITGHERRVRLLATSLGVSDALDDVLENSSSDALEGLGRYMSRILDERKGAEVAGSFSVALFLMIIAGSDLSWRDSILQLEQEKISAAERVVKGLRKQGADDFVIKYVEETLDKWILGKYPREDLKTFCLLIRVYLSFFEDIDLPQSVMNFLKRRIPVGDPEFNRLGREAIGMAAGSVQLVSGTDAFSSLTANKKEITVGCGERIRGSVTIQATNNLPDLYQVPLIMVPTWGDRKDNCVLINRWITTKKSQHVAEVDLKAPEISGTYFLLFSFNGETTQYYIASGTDWRFGYPVWNDTNDLVDLDAEEIGKAQMRGYIDMWYLYVYGYAPNKVPLDAIIIKVKS